MSQCLSKSKIVIHRESIYIWATSSSLCLENEVWAFLSMNTFTQVWDTASVSTEETPFNFFVMYQITQY